MNAKLNPVIRTRRPLKPIFPTWVVTVIHPDIQDVGPCKFDIRTLQRHTLGKQKNLTWMSGRPIYFYHRHHRILEGGLGYREFRAIRARGSKFYLKYLKGVIAFGWKSVVRDAGGDIYVPFICYRRDTKSVVLDWCWIGNGHFMVKGCSLLFPK